MQALNMKMMQQPRTLAGMQGNSMKMMPQMAQHHRRGSLQLVKFQNSVTGGVVQGATVVAPKMDCYQCEQTMDGKGCHDIGVCGKTPEVAALQDLIIYQAKGLGCLSHHARANGISIHAVDSFLNGSIFSTLTNVNFDDQRMYDFVMQAEALKDEIKKEMQAQSVALPPTPATGAAYWGTLPHPQDFVLSAHYGGNASPPLEDLIELSKKCQITIRKQSLGETLTGLQELIVYGLKGMCAYAHHAEALGHTDQKVFAFVAEALTFLSSPESSTVPACLAMALKVGEVNMIVLELLSNAHAYELGTPTPTSVPLVPKPGKAILITGHDMHDLDMLLNQTEGKGINVYTHGEMLPAHGYPKLHARQHLAGHFGGAWYRQKTDFAKFPGSILVTTNCVLDPLTSYRDNMFTTNETGVSGVTHVPGKDFSRVIQKALELPGFTDADVQAAEAGQGVAAVAGKNTGRHSVTVGFGHKTVLGVADVVLKAIEDKRLQHIFLIGGCDGNEPQRAYYSSLYKYMPQETMILTLGCGKFRIFDQDFGNLPGTELPRLLDMGQCNDAYSAIVVATELAKALKTDVNSLPLSLDLSWFEQKAVVVLLSLLHLGVKNIRLGPKLPAFLTAEAVQVLVDAYNLQPADEKNPEEDVKRMLSCV